MILLTALISRLSTTGIQIGLKTFEEANSGTIVYSVNDP